MLSRSRASRRRYSDELNVRSPIVVPSRVCSGRRTAIKRKSFEKSLYAIKVNTTGTFEREMCAYPLYIALFETCITVNVLFTPFSPPRHHSPGTAATTVITGTSTDNTRKSSRLTNNVILYAVLFYTVRCLRSRLGERKQR